MITVDREYEDSIVYKDENKRIKQVIERLKQENND